MLPVLVLVSLAALPVAQVAAQEHAQVRKWEHERSDLPVDDRLHFGSFDNGLRWVWAKNSEPKFRSYLRLHVERGSLAEEDSERGMAHFLEHMAFNGSEHFRPARWSSGSSATAWPSART
jgi:zinc protease